MEVSIDLIRPSPYQPRLSFKIDDLKEEIQRDGLLSPLIVRKVQGFYEIIDGERRLRALKELGWEKVPVEVKDIEDSRARLSVYKLNKIRESYSVEEEARYFKKLADGGMTAYQIGKELSINDTWVRAHLNIFKFSEDVQNAVWEGRLSVSHIQDMEPLIGASLEEATRYAREVYQRKLTLVEAREFISPRLEDIKKTTIEAAKRAIGTAVPIGEVTLEKPEELERAAKILREEARRKREEILTPEEKALLEAEKRRKEDERLKRKEEARKREEEMKGLIEEETKKRVEAERRRIEEETKEKVKEELLREPEFLRVAKAKAERVLPSLEMEVPKKPEPYLTLEEPLPVQYQHQRIWNLKQLIARDLSDKAKNFYFDFVTVGYSQKTLEDLSNSLKATGVTLLIDVRKNPMSIYKPEFNKNILEKDLTKVGIRYEHMPELGIPREIRDEAYEGRVLPQEVFERYEKEILTDDALAKIDKIAKGHRTIAFLCTEVDPLMCHRHKIAEALTRKGKIGYDL